MAFTSADIHKAIQDANQHFRENGIQEILSTETSFGYISLISRNIPSKQDTHIFRGLTTSEAYYWLVGFNTGLLNRV